MFNKVCVCETQCTMSPFEQFWSIYLTFDPEGWPWPFTTQNVQLHEIHMLAKYQVAIFNIAKVMANVLGFCFFDFWPWRSSLTLPFSQHQLCRSIRYTWKTKKKKGVYCFGLSVCHCVCLSFCVSVFLSKNFNLG